jgi:hypothetical protein
VTAIHDFDLHDAHDDALVDRLRRLDWPSADPEARDRCWDEFTRRMASLNGKPAAPTAARARLGDRYGCSRRQPTANGLIAGNRQAAAHSWARCTPGSIFGHARAVA